MKTQQLTAADFKRLLEEAEVYNFSTTEVCVASSEEDEFYFYYEPENDTITQKGAVHLTEDQEEAVKTLAFNHQGKTEEPLEPLNGYKEYGLSPEMFIKL